MPSAPARRVGKTRQLFLRRSLVVGGRLTPLDLYSGSGAWVRAESTMNSNLKVLRFLSIFVCFVFFVVHLFCSFTSHPLPLGTMEIPISGKHLHHPAGGDFKSQILRCGRSPDRATLPTAGLPFTGRPAVERFGGVRRPAPNSGSCQLSVLSTQLSGGKYSVLSDRAKIT